MNTLSPMISHLEKSENTTVAAAQKWGSPVSVDRGSESKGEKIRLQLDHLNVPERKGHIESRFLLRREKEVLDELQAPIGAMRRLFRSVSKTSLNRWSGDWQKELYRCERNDWNQLKLAGRVVVDSIDQCFGFPR